MLGAEISALGATVEACDFLVNSLTLFQIDTFGMSAIVQAHAHDGHANSCCQWLALAHLFLFRSSDFGAADHLQAAGRILQIIKAGSGPWPAHLDDVGPAPCLDVLAHPRQSLQVGNMPSEQYIFPKCMCITIHHANRVYLFGAMAVNECPETFQSK